MIGFSLIPIFMIGVLGSVHCVGMCGGIVGALSIVPASVRNFPVAVVASSNPTATGTLDGALRVVAYNLGRLGSYAIAGALAGGLARSAATMAGVSAVQTVGYWLVNLMLVALGLFVTGLWQGLTRLEALGLGFWLRLQPLTKYLAPLDSPLKLLAVGALWGWLPCGMVYSMLLTALLSGSAPAGAAVMSAFGLGTLPTLFILGMLGARLRVWMQRRTVRLASGLIVLGFGLLGLTRAASGLPGSWLDAICVTPAVATEAP